MYRMGAMFRINRILNWNVSLPAFAAAPEGFQ
jgi:hypothetical protein